MPHTKSTAGRKRKLTRYSRASIMDNAFEIVSSDNDSGVEPLQGATLYGT